ncbi:MAG: hypothetical protein ACRC1D_01900 [Culicoidibacterales bacterium]
MELTVDDKLAEDICSRVDTISQITKNVTKIVIDVKLYEIVRHMLSEETDVLNIKIEYTLSSIHLMMNSFQEYTNRIRTIKKLQEQNHIASRIEALMENVKFSKKKRSIRRLFRDMVK